jgi:hypothetical protein
MDGGEEWLSDSEGKLADTFAKLRRWWQGGKGVRNRKACGSVS